MGTGVPSGLQIHGGALEGSQVGSIPTHSLHFLSMKRVINATGILIHTNLGRSPLPKEVIRRLEETTTAYIPLEYDLKEGERGRRDTIIEGLLEELTGAETGIVVNNNAAGLLLTLNTIAGGREVIISRGELIELGESFRLPEVIASSGAILRVVGSINQTTIDDYRGAIGENTALIMVCHRSNFTVEGQVSSPDFVEIVKLAHSMGLPFVYDEGSGRLIEHITDGAPSLREAIQLGADLVLSSGDKLLGGPQAGLILGRRDYVMRLRKNHLFRALRVDKLTYIALRGVLEVYVESRESELPVIKNIEMNTQELKKRAQRVVRGLKKIGQKSVICEIVDSIAEVGGGSLPGIPLKSVAVKVRVEGINAHQLAGRLRLADTPIIGRIEGEWVVMDMRSLLEGEEAMIVKGIRRAID